MNKKRPSFRRWLFWLAVVGFVWFFASRLGDLKQLAAVLAAGRWQWVVLAAASQVGYFVLFAWMYQVAFSSVGVQTRVRELVPVVLGAVFVNTLAPSGGTAGMALYTDNAVRRG
ncbi:MAG: lysylphosphatidylglycerol synthase domain-containing protein, partial [Candidatus Bipolaricaulota bacterium]|nr:lysylphosphatidylglycerol synthase domain-containing protein [Candidatus Bipolaricaulota bacterium]